MSAGMDIESGLACWLGKDVGIGELKDKIFENSRVYHSESDSCSESSEYSSCKNAEMRGERMGREPRPCSEVFLKGCRSEGEIEEISSNGEDDRGLCFVMTRGWMAARRGLKMREEIDSSSSDVEGVKGIPPASDLGLEEREDVEVGELHSDRS